MSNSLWAYVLRRVIFLIPLLFGLSLIMFTLIHVAPGDPVLAMMGERAAANPQFVQQRRIQLGLDKPLPVQYLYWAKDLVKGDFGKAYTFNRVPVLTLIGQRLWSTVELQLIALVVGIGIAVPVGI